MAAPQFTLYSHLHGPNGWTVAFALKALGLTYETIYLDFGKGEHKAPDFTKYNPNGRIPALIDHGNGDFVIWESKAIMLYLVDTYDPDNKFSVGDAKERATMVQYLFFQASGVGPYFGQAAHFKMHAPEKIPYGIQRYTDEVARVIGVLENIFSRSSSDWLIANKPTIADLTFVMWLSFAFAALLPEGVDASSQFPLTKAWHRRLLELECVKSALAEQAQLKAQA